MKPSYALTFLAGGFLAAGAPSQGEPFFWWMLAGSVALIAAACAYQEGY